MHRHVPSHIRNSEITGCSNDNVGMGIQFVTLYKRVMDNCRARGISTELHAELFIVGEFPEDTQIKI